MPRRSPSRARTRRWPAPRRCVFRAALLPAFLQLRTLTSPSDVVQDGFTFDRAFAMDTKQMEIYQYGIQETVQGSSRPRELPRGHHMPAARADPLLSRRRLAADVMKGYNGTVFSYGQTGSGAAWLPAFTSRRPSRRPRADPARLLPTGKTFTMMVRSRPTWPPNSPPSLPAQPLTADPFASHRAPTSTTTSSRASRRASPSRSLTRSSTARRTSSTWSRSRTWKSTWSASATCSRVRP